MFAPISVIFGLLFFASTLPNGIRLVELPAEGNTVEIVAGYTTGGLVAFTSSAAARALLFDAYAMGAKVDLINELNRTALRIIAPSWSLPMLADRLAPLFAEIPKGNEATAPAPTDFRERVEDEIRSALLVQGGPVVEFATDDAFVLISGSAPAKLREALSTIPKRFSGSRPEDTIGRLPAERTLRFKSDLPAGAVIFASPIPGVYYKQWYSVLLLDRLIRRIVPVPLKTTLPLTARPYYYRLELAVPTGQFAEPAEDNLLQELQRLQFTPANLRDLNAARDEARAYIDSKPVREWFASHDLLSRRQEGIDWIELMSPDDVRVAARDLLISNRVIASWSPRPRQTSVLAEPLSVSSSSLPASSNRPSAVVMPAVGARPAFPAHTHAVLATPLPERLSSGVSIVASTTNAIFVSGTSMTRFDQEPTAEDLKAFQQYRADRILVLTPPSSLERMRQLWNSFKGSTEAQTGVPKGKVSGGDLAALFVLKTMLELKVIEAGWWPESSLLIEASEGSSLQIRSTEEQRAQILEWSKAIANGPLSDTDFAWVREVAIHRFDTVRPDLQALIWERDPQGTVQDLETVSPRHVQDVARIYF